MLVCLLRIPAQSMCLNHHPHRNIDESPFANMKRPSDQAKAASRISSVLNPESCLCVGFSEDPMRFLHDALLRSWSGLDGFCKVLCCDFSMVWNGSEGFSTVQVSVAEALNPNPRLLCAWLQWRRTSPREQRSSTKAAASRFGSMKRKSHRGRPFFHAQFR